MRVTHVITRLIVGGAQENTVASVLGLGAQPGIEADLISGPTTGPEGSLESCFATVPERLTVIPELVRPVNPWLDWRARRRLTEIFRAQRPDIVHTHSGKAGVLGRMAAHRAGVPIIVHTIHGPSFGRFQGAIANWAFATAERHVARYTSHFVTVADAMAEQYLAAGIGRREQYSRIFSGFPLEPFESATHDPALRSRLGFASGDFVVGKIARLFELKGHDLLFAAAPALVKRCPRIKFLLVGDGPLRRQFEHRAQELGLEKHFAFAGLIPPGDVPRYVGIMDALVHLSEREGLPRALPQALAAAKPVVACDCDGAREVCLNNQTGFLISPGDTEALVDRLGRLTDDAVLCERLGRQGQALVKGWFPVERMVDELHQLYQTLSSPGGSHCSNNPARA